MSRNVSHEEISKWENAVPIAEWKYDWMINEAITSAKSENQYCSYCMTGDTIVIAFLSEDGEANITIAKVERHGTIKL